MGRLGGVDAVVRGMIACVDDYQVQVFGTRCLGVLISSSGACAGSLLAPHGFLGNAVACPLILHMQSILHVLLCALKATGVRRTRVISWVSCALDCCMFVGQSRTSLAPRPATLSR